MKNLFCIICIASLFSCNNNHQETNADTIPQHINDTGLLKGKWLLLAMKGDTALHKQFIMGRPYINVSTATQMVGGFSGCNHFGGEALVTIDSLRLRGPVESTAIGCYGSGEDDFWQHLYKTRMYRVSKDSLILLDSSATATLQFTRATAEK